MPIELQAKNVWLYWIAKAYNGINNNVKANIYFKKIPHDFSYYSMLTQGELHSSTALNNLKPRAIVTHNDEFDQEIKNTLYLYDLGKANNCNMITIIATYQWFFLTRIASISQLLTMSVLANTAGYYNLSISAANKLPTRELYLSFPTPYLTYYTNYSLQMNIANSYPLAISRQESRFNTTVIAFDGGEGLMQIMPATAKYIFRKAKYSTCPRLNAQCNIKIGTWYLGSLYAKFGSYIYASAGYNAGPNRARRWQNNLSGLDNRIQMEMIPIQITRDYVQKVLTNKAIYDSKLQGLNNVNLLNYISSLSDAPQNLDILNDDMTDAGKL